MYVPFLCEAGADFGPAIIPWVAFVILAASNSLNISDGLDGLASGCTLITTPALALVVAGAGHAAWAGRFHLAYAPGVGELVVALAALIGAAAGFLWYNAHPAAIFMGDTGSLPIGGLLGYVAASAKQEILFIVIGAVFVFEMASVVLQVISFKTTGKRIFKIAPYHHSLEYRGWHENKVTMRLWILAALAASAGLGILALP
jgi:phospho-N-acetylmuramoyl-pentapeptide-transferase